MITLFRTVIDVLMLNDCIHWSYPLHIMFPLWGLFITWKTLLEWPLSYASFFFPFAQSHITISRSSLPEARSSPVVLKWRVFTHPSWCSSLLCKVIRFTSPQEPEVFLVKFLDERIPSSRDCRLGTKQWCAFIAILEKCACKKMRPNNFAHGGNTEDIKVSLVEKLVPLQPQPFVVKEWT